MRASEIKLLFRVPANSFNEFFMFSSRKFLASSKTFMQQVESTLEVSRRIHLRCEIFSVKCLKSISGDILSLLVRRLLVWSQHRCRHFDYSNALILCCSKSFLVCVLSVVLDPSGLTWKACVRLNGSRNKGKLSIIVVKQFLCHRKEATRGGLRFVHFRVIFHVISQHIPAFVRCWRWTIDTVYVSTYDCQRTMPQTLFWGLSMSEAI